MLEGVAAFWEGLDAQRKELQKWSHTTVYSFIIFYEKH